MTVTIDGTTGVSLVQDDTITDAKLALDANASEIKDALNASGSAPIYACRAWVNFNGTGTVAIRDSGNVSSISDLGVGSYTVNFSSSMPDVNYSAQLSSGTNASGGINSFFLDNPAVSSIQAYTYGIAGGGSGAYRDTGSIYVAIFR